MYYNIMLDGCMYLSYKKVQFIILDEKHIMLAKHVCLNPGKVLSSGD